MKIAIITPGVLPVPSVKGGAVETLIDYLLEYNENILDHEITIYGTDDNNLSDYNFNCYDKTYFDLFKQQSFKNRLKRKLVSLYKHNYYYNSFLDYFIAEVGKKISCEQFDIIIVENRPGFILSLSQCTNAKLILHLHNDTLDENAKEAKEILGKCAKVLTVSNYIKSKVDTIMSTDKVHVVYNGIDLERFRNPVNSEINRNSFHLSDDDFVVIYTGRIESVKGVKELLEAFSLLSGYKKMKLLIVGGGDGNVNEGEYLSEMHDLASSMPEKVTFTGFQSYEKVPSILHFCDLAVIPSIWEEPLSLTSLEDMAVGLPLVVTRSGGIPEAVDEECAIIVDNNAELASNLAKAILSLYKDQDKRFQMSVHAKERSALFSKKNYCQSFFGILKDL